MTDSAPDFLAVIVRDADTARPDLAPQVAGLHGISLGLSTNIPDDHAVLEHRMIIYDALYTHEVHSWKPAGPPSSATAA